MLITIAINIIKISIHALREEGDLAEANDQDASRCISIHALREEGDSLAIKMAEIEDNFYPRPPRGGRLHQKYCQSGRIGDFYPRPPRGGRHIRLIWRSVARLFLSTPSARRATGEAHGVGVLISISIHALREEGDHKYKHPSRNQGNFYPRPPRGGRPDKRWKFSRGKPISIHALREEGDRSAPRADAQG